MGAFLIIASITHINHFKFLDDLTQCLEKVKQKVNDDKFVLLTFTPEKSQFFCTILSMILKPDIFETCFGFAESVDEAKQLVDDWPFLNTIIEIDDMVYSGLQLKGTLRQMSKYNVMVVRPYVTKGFINKQLDQKHKLIYNQIIGYSYEIAHTALTDDKHPLRKDNRLRSVIDSLLGKEKYEYLDLMQPFSKNTGFSFPASNTFFDHKIADPLSTFLFALNTGYVLHSANTTVQFIKNCESFDPTLLQGVDDPIDWDNMVDLGHVSDFDFWGKQENRCPFAWYKYINYQSGDVNLEKFKRNQISPTISASLRVTDEGRRQTRSQLQKSPA